MKIINSRTIALGALTGLMASAALAQGYQARSISIQHPWSRETAVGQAAGGGFMTITNSGVGIDRLVSGTTPVAAEVQLHTMTMDGGVMRMRQVTDGIAVPARGSVELRPGSIHVMFVGLKRQLRRGERFPVTFQFQRAGRVTVQFAVQPIGSTGRMEGGHGAH